MIDLLRDPSCEASLLHRLQTTRYVAQLLLSCRQLKHQSNVLNEVQLLVARGCPEVLTVIGKVFFFLFAFFVGKGLTALFAKG